MTNKKEVAQAVKDAYENSYDVILEAQ